MAIIAEAGAGLPSVGVPPGSADGFRSWLESCSLAALLFSAGLTPGIVIRAARCPQFAGNPTVAILTAPLPISLLVC